LQQISLLGACLLLLYLQAQFLIQEMLGLCIHQTTAATDSSLSKFSTRSLETKMLYLFVCLISLLSGLLTKKLIILLQEAKDRTIDLNKAAEEFAVEQ
jgi:hypothetical protein